MSDNEHTAPSLGNGAGEAMCSTVLSVQHSVGDAIPELRHPPDDGAKRPSSIRRQDTGDIFPKAPADTIFRSDCQKDECEVPAGVSQAFSESGDAERLAGGSSHKKIN